MSGMFTSHCDWCIRRIGYTVRLEAIFPTEEDAIKAYSKMEKDIKDKGSMNVELHLVGVLTEMR